MKPMFGDFNECYQTCKQFQLNEHLTAQQCWNEGYRLGRARWFWGPAWFVALQGWINTQRSKLKFSVHRDKEKETE